MVVNHSYVPYMYIAQMAVDYEFKLGTSTIFVENSRVQYNNTLQISVIRNRRQNAL